MGQKIRIAQLRKVFRNDDDSRQFDAKLARICVLFEDLRIEIQGVAERSIPVLDVLDPEKENRLTPELTGRYRQFYFVRRSLATLREFAEAVRLIDDDIKKISALRMGLSALSDEEARSAWSDAVQFFRTNEKLIKNVRGDIGGHFGHAAALNAVARLLPEAQGSIALVDDNAKLRLHFALEIAGTALIKHLKHEQIGEYHVFLKECLLPGYQHAVDSVYILTRAFLWDRFGS